MRDGGHLPPLAPQVPRALPLLLDPTTKRRRPGVDVVAHGHHEGLHVRCDGGSSGTATGHRVIPRRPRPTPRRVVQFVTAGPRRSDGDPGWIAMTLAVATARRPGNGGFSEVVHKRMRVSPSFDRGQDPHRTGGAIGQAAGDVASAVSGTSVSPRPIRGVSGTRVGARVAVSLPWFWDTSSPDTRGRVAVERASGPGSRVEIDEMKCRLPELVELAETLFNDYSERAFTPGRALEIEVYAGSAPAHATTRHRGRVACGPGIQLKSLVADPPAALAEQGLGGSGGPWRSRDGRAALWTSTWADSNAMAGRTSVLRIHGDQLVLLHSVTEEVRRSGSTPRPSLKDRSLAPTLLGRASCKRLPWTHLGGLRARRARKPVAQAVPSGGGAATTVGHRPVWRPPAVVRPARWPGRVRGTAGVPTDRRFPRDHQRSSRGAGLRRGVGRWLGPQQATPAGAKPSRRLVRPNRARAELHRPRRRTWVGRHLG